MASGCIIGECSLCRSFIWEDEEITFGKDEMYHRECYRIEVISKWTEIDKCYEWPEDSTLCIVRKFNGEYELMFFENRDRCKYNWWDVSHWMPVPKLEV